MSRMKSIRKLSLCKRRQWRYLSFNQRSLGRHLRTSSKRRFASLEPAVEGVVWGAEGGQASVHMDRLRQISDELGVKMIIPLAGKSEEQNLVDFTQEGFEATIIVVDSDLLSEDWLGRKVDADFLQTIRRS